MILVLHLEVSRTFSGSVLLGSDNKTMHIEVTYPIRRQPLRSHDRQAILCASACTLFWPQFKWHIYSNYAIAEWQCVAVDRKCMFARPAKRKHAEEKIDHWHFNGFASEARNHQSPVWRETKPPKKYKNTTNANGFCNSHFAMFLFSSSVAFLRSFLSHHTAGGQSVCIRQIHDIVLILMSEQNKRDRNCSTPVISLVIAIYVFV